MSKNNNSNSLLTNICIDFLSSENFKIHLTNITQPIIKNFLNEIGVYLYIFIFYILISFFLHLGILIILIRYINKTNNLINK